MPPRCERVDCNEERNEQKAVPGLRWFRGCGSGPWSCGRGGSAGSGSSASGDAAEVYFLQFKPEVDKEWKEIAKAYKEEKGVEVKIVTAASNTYEEKLKSEMSKSSAPTLFQVNGPTGLKNWKDYCCRPVRYQAPR